MTGGWFFCHKTDNKDSPGNRRKGVTEMKGKLLSCLLAAVLMLTIIPQTAFAEDTAENSNHEKIVEATIQEIGEQFGDESRDPYNYLDKRSGVKLRSGASAYPEYFDLRNVDTDNDGKAGQTFHTAEMGKSK